jgi:aspartyl-tRNA(Asn)/glutamyl-tRNA(Gln) amidotransferase subunit C
MPAAFSRADIERIAALAHLELEEDEVELFARQLGDILDYANQLQAIDTSGVAPTAHLLAGGDGDRADMPVGSLDREAALANAPDGAPEVGFFRVPRVIG